MFAKEIQEEFEPEVHRRLTPYAIMGCCSSSLQFLTCPEKQYDIIASAERSSSARDRSLRENTLKKIMKKY